MKKDVKRCYSPILRYFVLLNRELERKAEMELGVRKHAGSYKRAAAHLGMRLNFVTICNHKSHFVAINSRALYGMIREIHTEFDVRKIEFTSENQDSHWKHTFDIERRKTSKNSYLRVRSKAIEFANRDFNAPISTRR
jgi:peptide methionine sulfoxide reductase MsrB